MRVADHRGLGADRHALGSADVGAAGDARGDEAGGHRRTPRYRLLRSAGFDAVVNLAGALVAQRWTEAAKPCDPRQPSARNATRLVEALRAGKRRGRAVLVSSSAAGYYGDRGDDVVDESTARGSDFLAGVCVDWEGEARRSPPRNSARARRRWSARESCSTAPAAR